MNLLVHTNTIHKFTCIYNCTHTYRKSMSKQIYYYTMYTHTFSIRKCKLQCANALERLSTLDNSYTINCHINQVDRTWSDGELSISSTTVCTMVGVCVTRKIPPCFSDTLLGFWNKIYPVLHRLIRVPWFDEEKKLNLILDR